MNAFGPRYLLETDAAVGLYAAVEDGPIVDPHSHVDVPRIVENEGWSDIWEVEGATDHYVWEMMRKRGVIERRITGDAPNREKWFALAGVFPELAGNPVYEWVHLDLKNRFNIQKTVSRDTADEIWEQTRERLQEPDMLPQQVLRNMNVEVLCSTDDPADPLENHRRAAEEMEEVRVLPTWRPDDYMRIDRDEWQSRLDDLRERTNKDLSTVQDLLDALRQTHERFAQHGCRASDHGLERAVSRPVTAERADDVYRRGLAGKNLDESEAADFKSFMLQKFADMNKESGWVMQLHIGAVRDYRHSLHKSLGADSGGDVATLNIDFTRDLRHLLNSFDDELQIVIYCLDPAHYQSIATLTRAFPNASMGAPWWFNDSPSGIEKQLRQCATVDLLANHAGMVSDSRKILSYSSRMEMFRRCLCNVLGRMVERGQMPGSVARRTARWLSYDRPRKLFGLDEA